MSNEQSSWMVGKTCIVELERGRAILVGDDNRMNGLDFYAVLRTRREVDALIAKLQELRERLPE